MSFCSHGVGDVPHIHPIISPSHNTPTVLSLGVPHLHHKILLLVPCPSQRVTPSPSYNTSTGPCPFWRIPHLHPIIDPLIPDLYWRVPRMDRVTPPPPPHSWFTQGEIEPLWKRKIWKFRKTQNSISVEGTFGSHLDWSRPINNLLKILMLIFTYWLIAMLQKKRLNWEHSHVNNFPPMTVA